MGIKWHITFTSTLSQAIKHWLRQAENAFQSVLFLSGFENTSPKNKKAKVVQ